MTVRIGVLGVEIVTVTFVPLDLGYAAPAGRRVTALDSGIKRLSGWWVGRMNR